MIIRFSIAYRKWQIPGIFFHAWHSEYGYFLSIGRIALHFQVVKGV